MNSANEGFVITGRQKGIRAREIVMVAILSALTVMGNLLSFQFLPIQAGTGMVIISGVAFGPIVGFVVGMVARLVCNFYLGQGLYTIWQMLSWGLLGLISGVVFSGKMNSKDIEEKRSKKWIEALLRLVAPVVILELLAYISYVVFPAGEDTFSGWRMYLFGIVGVVIGIIISAKRMPINNITLAIFTFLNVFIIYGGIMNLCTAILSSINTSGGLTLDGLRLVYLTGVSYDFVHALKAAVFVLFFGRIMVAKLERIKIKYGFYRHR